MRAALAAAAALALSGCATTGGLGRTACQNRTAIEAGLDIALTQAFMIADPVKREAAIAAVNVSRAALAKCP